MGILNTDLVEEITTIKFTEFREELVEQYKFDELEKLINERIEDYLRKGLPEEQADAKARSESQEIADLIDIDDIESAAERDAYIAAVEAAEKEVEDLEDRLAYEAERAS